MVWSVAGELFADRAAVSPTCGAMAKHCPSTVAVGRGLG